MNTFQALCRSKEERRGTVFEVNKDTMTDKQVDMVNINSHKFSSIWSVIMAKLIISCSSKDATIQ